MVEKKSFWQSKTLWINVITLVITVLGMAADWTFVTPQAAQIIVFALAAANVILRLLTSAPITETATRKANEETL